MATPKTVKIDMPFPVFSTEADTDYILARMVHFVGGKFGSRAGFFGQQCCEKYMKALSVQHDGTYIETHGLLALARKCEVYGEYFSEAETKRILEQFDLFDQIGRYGGPANFDPLSKGRTVGGLTVKTPPGAQLAGAWMWTPKYLQGP
jgi:HEPN domain